jgi:predicted amidohydrolase
MCTPWLQGDKDTLKKIQEKAVSMVSGLKGKTHQETCAELGIKTLETGEEVRTWF